MISITNERWERNKANIHLEEVYSSREYETTTLYFTAPKDIADGCLDSDIGVEISVEFPTLIEEDFEPCYAGVSISPTGDVDGTLTDYDWVDWDAPYEYIEHLLKIYNSGVNHRFKRGTN